MKRLQVFVGVILALLMICFSAGYAIAAGQTQRTAPRQPNAQVRATAAPIPEYAKVAFINYANGYVFTGFVLTDGTQCVLIERDAGALEAWRQTTCDFNHSDWFHRKNPSR